MALTEAFGACIRSLEREYHDAIIQHQTSFSSKMFEIRAANSSSYPQGLVNIARKAALEFVRNATDECASVQDLTDPADFDNAQQHLVNAAYRLLGVGRANPPMSNMNAPSEASGGFALKELRQEIRDRLVIAQEKEKAKGVKPASCWTMLFLVSHPRDNTFISTNRESREVRQVIRESEYREQIRFVVEPAVRIRDLFKSVNEHRPRVIHFSGHGNQDCMALLDDQDQMKVFDADHLAELIATMEEPAELVVVNSCESQPQVTKLMKVVQYTIGTKGPLDDDAAVVFSRTFYSALAHGKSIDSSFRQGLAAVSAETGLSASELYELSCQESCDAKNAVLILSSDLVLDQRRSEKAALLLQRKKENDEISAILILLPLVVEMCDHLGGRVSWYAHERGRFVNRAMPIGEEVAEVYSCLINTAAQQYPRFVTDTHSQIAEQLKFIAETRDVILLPFFASLKDRMQIAVQSNQDKITVEEIVSEIQSRT